MPTLDAAWLDFNGPLTLKRVAAIGRFARARMFGDSTLIISALDARYDSETAAAIGIDHPTALSEMLTFVLPNASISEAIKYKDSSPMLHFVLHLGEGKRQQRGGRHSDVPWLKRGEVVSHCAVPFAGTNDGEIKTPGVNRGRKERD